MRNIYAYSPYGETTTLGPDNGNPLQYTGRENDGAGLYYYRARYYDPILKQFISEDPIGTMASLNFHAYVGGDPLSYTDPYGLFEMYGNWGGKNWSGGQAGPRIPSNPKSPTDSMDACFMAHDYCTQMNEDNQACRAPSYPFKAVQGACDQSLVQCLQQLPKNTSQWPLPPKNLVYGKNQHSPSADDFRDKAIFWYKK